MRLRKAGFVPGEDFEEERVNRRRLQREHCLEVVVAAAHMAEGEGAEWAAAGKGVKVQQLQPDLSFHEKPRLWTHRNREFYAKQGEAKRRTYTTAVVLQEHRLHRAQISCWHWRSLGAAA